MARRFSFRGTRKKVAVAAAAAGLVMCFSGQAQAATPGCGHLIVNLHGTAPASSICADGATSGSVSPNVSVLCASGALRIYQNGGLGGYSICFAGTGTADMTNYTMPNGNNWNDRASSARTGSRYVVFWSDTAERGRSDSVALTNYTFAFDSSSAVGNDALSSINVY